MWKYLSVRAHVRVVIASALGVMLVAACSNPGSQSEAPKTVAADAQYSETELPFAIESAPSGLAVAPSGELYMKTQENLESLEPGAAEPRVVVPDLPSAFGFAVTDSRAIAGNFENLVVVDLGNTTVEDLPVVNVGEIWAVAADPDGNVYVTGAGRPEGRVVKLDRELSKPTNIPFPDLAGNSSIAVGPDDAIYVVDFFAAEVRVLRHGEQNPATLQLEEAEGPVRVAVSPSGDLLVIDNLNPGRFSTDPLPVRLLRYPVGSTSPVELAKYDTNSYLIAADAAGNVYYTQEPGDGRTRVMKLSPKV